MSVIDRRLGLLFAAFVVLLGLIVVRAAWVQGVRGAGLSAEAQSQQVESVVVPGSRGTIRDRSGRELAVSEDAATIYATPYQVKDAEETAHKLAKILGLDQDDVLRSLADRNSGFAYIERKASLADAERIRKLDLPGIGMLPDSRRIYPQGELASQVIGTVGIDNQGLTGLEAADDSLLHGTDGERQVVRDGLGDELERNTVEGAQTGADLKLTLDASLQAETEKVLAGIGRRVHAGRCDGDRHGPAQLGHPRDGELAELRSGEARRCDPGRAPQHGNRLHLRAGLDLQGVHGRRGARGAAGDAGDDVRPAARDPGRRSDDLRRRGARLRDPLGRPDPRPILERRRDQDRARARRRQVRPLGAHGSGSARRPGSRIPARNAES